MSKILAFIIIILSAVGAHSHPSRNEVIQESPRQLERVATIAGSFDPFHRGHLAMVEALLKENTVDTIHIVVNYHGTKSYLLSVEERMHLIVLSTQHLGMRVKVVPEPYAGRTTYAAGLEAQGTFKVSRVIGADGWDGVPDYVKKNSKINWIVFPRAPWTINVPKAPNFTIFPIEQYNDLGIQSSVFKYQSNPDLKKWLQPTAAKYAIAKGLYSQNMPARDFHKIKEIAERLINKNLDEIKYQANQTKAALVEDIVRKNSNSAEAASALQKIFKAELEQNSCSSLFH